jgi:hypothetical protein
VSRFAPAALALLLFAACAGETTIKSTDIVDTIPWADGETATYRVLDDDDDEVGTLTLSVERDGETFVLGQFFEFPETEFINEAKVVVDDTKLQPLTTNFRIDGPEGERTCEATYEGSDVSIHNVGEDGERDDTLNVPSIAYDSWSDLFVWRTIDFTRGYEVEYADMLTCVLARAQRLGVKLEVKEAEEIEVPAGTFETWRVEIEAGSDQKAWFTTDDAHMLVKYDNGSEVFELVEVGASE